MILVCSICCTTTHTVNLTSVVIKVSQGVHLGFAAEDQVGFNKDGGVVVKEITRKTLHEYRLQIQERNVYQESRSEDFPSGVNDASIRSSSGPSVLLQDKNTATQKRSFHNLQPWKSWHHEGTILPCSRMKCVYAVEKTDGEYEIIIDDYNSKARLQPVTGGSPWKDPYLSLCMHGGSDRIAVTSTNNTLQIYSKASKFCLFVCFSISAKSLAVFKDRTDILTYLSDSGFISHSTVAFFS